MDEKQTAALHGNRLLGAFQMASRTRLEPYFEHVDGKLGQIRAIP